MNDRYDEILSTTLKNYRDTLVDNVTKDVALFNWLDQKGNKKTETGGEAIVVPVMYALNSTVGSYSGYDIIDTTPQKGIGNALYQWKQAAGSVSISGREFRQNNSEHAIIKLLDAKVEQLKLSLADHFNERLFKDGSGNDGKDIDGLALIVDSSPSTGVVGGIDAAVVEVWRNFQTSGAKTTNPFDNLIKKMNTTYNSISKGIDHPDFGVATQTVFEGYEGQLTKNINYNVALVDTKMADFGFQNLKFKGMMLVYDDACNAGCMYMLNSRYLNLVAHKDADFAISDFIKPETQDAKAADIIWMGNLICSNRARQGVITNIT